jgi:tetratricopeptide (TPR) repeat protein
LARAAGRPKLETGALEVGAVLYGDRMDWTNALSYYQRTLDNCRKTNDEEVVSDVLNGMAECYLGLDRPAEALAAALESKEHALRLGLSHALPLTYSFIGTAYVDLDEFDLAVQAHREAVEAAVRSGIRRSLTIARLRLGGSLLAAGQRSDSRYEFLAALELAKAEQLPHHLARAYAGLADCAEADDLTEHAVTLLDHAIEAVSEGWPDFADDLRDRQRALRDRQPV